MKNPAPARRVFAIPTRYQRLIAHFMGLFFAFCRVVSSSTALAGIMHTLYKICPAPLWQEAERIGVFRGSEIDHRDNFIHFSTAAQVIETAAKHFVGQNGLVLVSVDAARLGDALKWETSRGGALFPHLYGHLDLAAVIGAVPLPLGPDGRHVFPPLKD